MVPIDVLMSHYRLKDTYLVDFSKTILKNNISKMRQEIAEKCEKILFISALKKTSRKQNQNFCIFKNFIQPAIELKVA